MMTKNKRIDIALELVREADSTLLLALQMLNGKCPLAAEHIVEAQGQCLDAMTHMETCPLSKKKKSVS